MPFIDLFPITPDWGEGTVQSANPASDSLGGQVLGAGANSGGLTITYAVPEPTTMALIIWAVGGVFVLERRRAC